MTRTFTCLCAGVAMALLGGTAAQAQVRPYAVVEAGLERRQVLADGERIPSDAGITDRKKHKDGFAYAIAIGAEAPVSSVLFAGVEAEASRSEVNTRADQFRGVEVTPGVLVGAFERTAVHPRWSYAVTARAGANVTRSLAIYGLAGLGGERVRREVTSGVADFGGGTTVRSRQRFDALTFGAGARVFLSDHIGARVEYRRLATDDGYDPQRLMAGLLFRL